MQQRIGLVSLVVDDYDDALAFFVREPSHQQYGTVVVFKDLYGNLWDLIEPG